MTRANYRRPALVGRVLQPVDARPPLIAAPTEVAPQKGHDKPHGILDIGCRAV